MLKAMREAKVYTSWLNPSEPHERAMAKFLETTLAPDNAAFRHDFIEFQHRIAHYGIYNSLAQVAVKIGAPGVPDFYQGCELWDLRLVDPDNRGAVDYEARRAMLAEFSGELNAEARRATATRLMADPRNPRLKLYATTMMLRFRRERPDIFQLGSYEAMAADGARRDHVFAFERRLGDRGVIVAVPRLVATLLSDADVPPLGERVWGDTTIAVSPGSPAVFRNILTGACVKVERAGNTPSVRAADVFDTFPVALLAGN
jgi:(1->4)-alpha-D-glucan 1-alpha-D-glucosylmutase